MSREKLAKKKSKKKGFRREGRKERKIPSGPIIREDFAREKGSLS